jgi:SagB-type dehydrogenase family enzyme
MTNVKEARSILRSDHWSEFGKQETDQKKGVPAPPAQKPYPKNAELVELMQLAKITVGVTPLKDVIDKRRSRRRFTETPLTLEELSYLLWSTQGVQVLDPNGVRNLRTVPSAGCRHSFETYLVINRVRGVKPGLYRYLPLDHKLLYISGESGLDEKITEACNNQRFIKDAAVVFVWTTIPYRMEWRYSFIAPKIIAIDAGHMCQNLYLASESIGAGTCGIGAYNQAKVDAFLGVDGLEELTIYIAPVGKI